MRPTITRGATHNFKPPENWVPETDGECGDLQVRAEMIGARGIIELTSTWKPTDEERALIAQGGVIEIGICSATQPAMCVGVVEPMDPKIAAYLQPQPDEPSAKRLLTINEEAHGDYHDRERD